MHSCGKVDTLMDDFVECGFDGWEPCMVCNDLDQIVKSMEGISRLAAG